MQRPYPVPIPAPRSTDYPAWRFRLAARLLAFFGPSAGVRSETGVLKPRFA
jgi:hypothetical protein